MIFTKKREFANILTGLEIVLLHWFTGAERGVWEKSVIRSCKSIVGQNPLAVWSGERRIER